MLSDAGGGVCQFQAVFAGVAQEALQFFLRALFVGTDLERAFVSEVGTAWFGVQRVQLIDVVLGPTDEIGGLALQVDGE